MDLFTPSSNGTAPKRDPRTGSAVGGEHALNMAQLSARAESNSFDLHYVAPTLKQLEALVENGVSEWGDKQALADATLLRLVKAARGLDNFWLLIYKTAAIVRDNELYRLASASTPSQGRVDWATKPCDSFEDWWVEHMKAPFERFKTFERAAQLAALHGIAIREGQSAEDFINGLRPEQKVKVAQATGTLNQASAVQEQHSPGQGARTELQDNILKLDNGYGTGGVQTYRRIQKLARGGNAEAAELLDQIDRGETTPHAAYVALGLRRPQISAQLEPWLHEELMAWTEATGDSVRDAVESALEMFFRRMKRLEEQPEPKAVPAVESPKQEEPEAPAPVQAAAAAPPALGDRITGAAAAALVGVHKTVLSTAASRAGAAEKPVAHYAKDGWSFTREVGAADKRWVVTSTPSCAPHP
jgi:hypothetical protein